MIVIFGDLSALTDPGALFLYSTAVSVVHIKMGCILCFLFSRPLFLLVTGNHSLFSEHGYLAEKVRPVNI